tara:strand:- start:309 stop:995 length:687 start_codon:yes stop_codon:yes gene_type:complete
MNILYKIKLHLNLIFYKYFKRKLYYSKNCEDIFLSNYFKNKAYGRYIDIGAYHPYRSSNTCLLNKRGWRGINIDISKTSIDLFNIARPNDINLNIAVTDKKGKINIYENKNLGLMNTTNKFFASFFLKKYKLRKIQSDNLNNILKKYSNKNNRFNLIDIDAEGSDYSILKKINFKKYIFQLILIETHTFNSKTKNEKRKIYSFLKSKKYNYLKELHETSIFINSKWKN